MSERRVRTPCPNPNVMSERVRTDTYLGHTRHTEGDQMLAGGKLCSEFFLIFKGTLFFDEQESVKSEVGILYSGRHYSASFAFLFSELHSLSKLHLFKPSIFYLAFS